MTKDNKTSTNSGKSSPHQEDQIQTFEGKKDNHPRTAGNSTGQRTGVGRERSTVEERRLPSISEEDRKEEGRMQADLHGLLAVLRLRSQRSWPC